MLTQCFAEPSYYVLKLQPLFLLFVFRRSTSKPSKYKCLQIYLNLMQWFSICFTLTIFCFSIKSKFSTFIIIFNDDLHRVLINIKFVLTINRTPLSLNEPIPVHKRTRASVWPTIIFYILNHLQRDTTMVNSAHAYLSSYFLQQHFSVFRKLEQKTGSGFAQTP